MSASLPILSVEQLRISFESEPVFTAVDQISFSLDAKQTLAIVGESGSGKSLTALALMGLAPPEAHISGAMHLQGQPLPPPYSTKWNRLRGNKIGMIFQEPMSALNPVMKIGDQLKESILTHQNITHTEAQHLTVDWLRKVQLPNPDEIYGRYPHQLSGGQKQRVMIAMAMCNDPVLLIADEPTTALDVTVQSEIITLMQSLQQQANTALIFITHDLYLAHTIADKVMVMWRGQVVESGNIADVFIQPRNNYTKALLACRPSPQSKGKTLPVVDDFLRSETVISQPLTPARRSLEPLLTVNDLSVVFGGDRNWLGRKSEAFKAVDDVGFTLYSGEVLGIVGESGCGKSTLSRCIMGLLPASEGSIYYKGRDITKLNDREWKKVRKNIQLIFQDPFASLNPRMTIGAMLSEPLAIHHIVPASQVNKEARRLLDLVHLPSDAFNRYPHQFSGGQRQRISIARALSLRPEILICDESVSALDVSVQAQILNLLKELQSQFDLAYLFISHDLSVVYYISDRILVMQSGKIVESGSTTKVMTEPANAYTQRLIEAIPGPKNQWEGRD